MLVAGDGPAGAAYGLLMPQDQLAERIAVPCRGQRGESGIVLFPE